MARIGFSVSSTIRILENFAERPFWCCISCGNSFLKDSVHDVSHLFPKGSFTPATFDSVTFEVLWELPYAQELRRACSSE
jgi:hypothetical protein